MEFWKRHAGRKPWVFHDRFQLAYLFEPAMSVAPYYHQQSVIADTMLAAFLERHIQPGQTVVDVHSGMGGAALLAAKLIKEEGAVFAIEPDPAAYRLLLNNITLNGFTRLIRAIGRPVTETDGANHVLKLDTLAESWNIAKIDLLCLHQADDIAACLESAQALLKRGAVERILCVGAVEKLREVSAVRELTTAGYVLHGCTADGTLQPLDGSSQVTGNFLVAVHKEAGRGG